MKKEIWICDRCKKEIKVVVPTTPFTVSITVFVNKAWDVLTLDLCKQCREYVEEYFSINK